MAGKRLTEQQKLWCRHYVVEFNATRSAVLAGYGVAGAGRRGYENSHNALCLAYVHELTAPLNKKIEINAEYVRTRLVEIDQLDLGDLLDDDGRMLSIKQWPKVWRTSISGVDFGDLIEASQDPDDKRMIQLLKKIKWPDKTKNLELLGKHVAVSAWERDPEAHRGEPESLTITFEVAEAKAEVKVTNAST